MTKLMRKREKIRAQMKSRFYYMFWGAMAGAVVGGQIYVGTSYRAMAKSMNRWFEETIEIITMPMPRRTSPPMPYYLPMPSSPEDYDNMPIIK